MRKNMKNTATHSLGLWLLLTLTLPVGGDPLSGTQEKTEAARVLKKVEKARHRAQEQARDDIGARTRFRKELDRYQNLHNDLVKRLSEDGAVTGGDLALALRASRAEAGAGDILIREVRPLFRRLIAEQLSGPDTLAAREAVAEENPALDKDVVVSVKVNALYPAGATRSTVPPSLLLSLPTLPDCLHYRFVGRDLILVDSVAQVIADFLPAAIPAPSARRPR